MPFSVEIVLPLFIGFAVSALSGLALIPFLTRLKASQTEREDGVESHLKKAGTPTMGGLMIILGLLVGTLVFARTHFRVLPVLLLTIGFGVIGFIDDFLKVVLKRSDGLLPKQKMLGQIIVTTAFVVWIWLMDSSLLELRIPFTGGFVLSGMAVRIIATPLAYFAIIGTVNGVNFTDGLDGLASSVTSVVALFLLLASLTLGGEIEPVCTATLGGLLGFLLYNAYPAKVFMGDTGSLALGGFVAGCAYMMRMPIFIIIYGLIYLVEVLSVILQVTYFKKTGGKRIFKMAPIHHHLELCGWSETRIVTVFTIITLILCALAWAAL